MEKTKTQNHKKKDTINIEHNITKVSKHIPATAIIYNSYF